MKRMILPTVLSLLPVASVPGQCPPTGPLLDIRIVSTDCDTPPRDPSPAVFIANGTGPVSVDMYVEARILCDPSVLGFTTVELCLVDDGTGSFAPAQLTADEVAGFPCGVIGGSDPGGRSGLFPDYRAVIGDDNLAPGNGRQSDCGWSVLPFNLSFTGDPAPVNGYTRLYKFTWSSDDRTPRTVDVDIIIDGWGGQTSAGLVTSSDAVVTTRTIDIRPVTFETRFVTTDAQQPPRDASPLIVVTNGLDPVSVTLYCQGQLSYAPNAVGLVLADPCFSDDGSGTFAAAPLTADEAAGTPHGTIPGDDPSGRAGLFPPYRALIGDDNTREANGTALACGWQILPLNISPTGVPAAVGAWDNLYKLTWSTADPTTRLVSFLAETAGAGYWDESGMVIETAVAQAVPFVIDLRLATTLYVDQGAPPMGTGVSWSTALHDLQEALDLARLRPEVVEIRVAQGTYKPDAGTDRTRSFQLVSNVAILGGYAGIGAPDPDARDPQLYPTILSGDLLGDNDPGNFLVNRADDSNNIITVGEAAGATIDGFTIAHSWAVTAPHNYGGGLLNQNGVPIAVSNCTFYLNDGNFGGAVSSNGNLTAHNCIFYDNHVRWEGGAVMLRGGSNEFHNCKFISNLTTDDGGAVYIESSASGTFVNCLFDKSTAAVFDGGHAYIETGGHAELVNCTLVSGHAGTSGGGIFAEAGAAATVTNTIVWNSSTDSASTLEKSQLGGPGAYTVNYSIIAGWTGALGGEGNGSDAPCFTDTDGADNVPGTPDDDLTLRQHSPGIDAGSNLLVPSTATTDLAGLPRFHDDPGMIDTGPTGNGHAQVVDIGAHEFQGMSGCPCEMTGDDPAAVDVFDLLAFINLWFQDEPAADLDCNEIINVFDLLEYIDCWFTAVGGVPCS